MYKAHRLRHAYSTSASLNIKGCDDVAGCEKGKSNEKEIRHLREDITLKKSEVEKMVENIRIDIEKRIEKLERKSDETDKDLLMKYQDLENSIRDLTESELTKGFEIQALRVAMDRLEENLKLLSKQIPTQLDDSFADLKTFLNLNNHSADIKRANEGGYKMAEIFLNHWSKFAIAVISLVLGYIFNGGNLGG